MSKCYSYSLGIKDNPYTRWIILCVMPSVLIEPVTECHDWSHSIITIIIIIISSLLLKVRVRVYYIIFASEMWELSKFTS